jgi:hypothetical protein
VPNANYGLDVLVSEYLNYILSHCLSFVGLHVERLGCPSITETIWSYDSVALVREKGDLKTPITGRRWESMQKEEISSSLSWWNMYVVVREIS